MGRLEEDVNFQNEIQRRIQSLVATEVGQLTKLQELGTQMSFVESAPVFSAIIGLFRELSEIMTGAQLPHVWLETINGALNNAQNLFNQVIQFSLTTPPTHNRNIAAERTSMIASVDGIFDNIFTAVYPIISFYSARSNKIGKMQVDAAELLEQMRGEFAELQSIKTEARSALDVVRNLAQEAGVSQHANLFSDEAKGHQRAARWWLGMVSFTTLVTVGVAIFFFHRAVDPQWFYTNTQAVQAAIAKIALLSVLFSAVIWTGRMYRSHRHNAVLNKHRSNALRTFETFAKATDDKDTKNAVLIKATECIFAPQATGYTSHESEAGGVAQVVEIVRGIGSGGKT